MAHLTNEKTEDQAVGSPHPFRETQVGTRRTSFGTKDPSIFDSEDWGGRYLHGMGRQGKQ